MSGDGDSDGGCESLLYLRKKKTTTRMAKSEGMRERMKFAAGRRGLTERAVQVL